MSSMADHETAWELIPWYVNGTLDAAEHRLVERHLADCGACRAEVELCRGLVEAGGNPEDLAPAPHPARLDRLVAEIVAGDHEPEADRPADGAGERRGAGRSVRSPADTPGRTAVATWRGVGRLAAAALVVLAAGTAGYLLAPRSGSGADAPAPAQFRTLSRPEAPLEPPAGVRSGGAVLRVVFAPEAPEREIRRILRAVGGVVVGGPSPLGVYTVRLTAEPGAEEPVPVVLEHLRREPMVLFVEAIDDGVATGLSP